MDLRQDAQGNPVMTNCSLHKINNERDALHVLQQAIANRTTKSTKVNNVSSRSHLVTTYR